MKTITNKIKKMAFWFRTFVLKQNDSMFYKLTMISFPYESCSLTGKLDFSNE